MTALTNSIARMYDVVLHVPDGHPEFGEYVIARGVTEEQANTIRSRSVRPVTLRESAWESARCAEPTQTATANFVPAVPTSSTTEADTTYFVWMDMGTRGNSRPWSMVADWLTRDDVDAFLASPARRISVQPRPTT